MNRRNFLLVALALALSGCGHYHEVEDGKLIKVRYQEVLYSVSYVDGRLYEQVDAEYHSVTAVDGVITKAYTLAFGRELWPRDHLLLEPERLTRVKKVLAKGRDAYLRFAERKALKPLVSSFPDIK